MGKEKHKVQKVFPSRRIAIVSDERGNMKHAFLGTKTPLPREQEKIILTNPRSLALQQKKPDHLNKKGDERKS